MSLSLRYVPAFDATGEELISQLEGLVGDAKTFWVELLEALEGNRPFQSGVTLD